MLSIYYWQRLVLILVGLQGVQAQAQQTETTQNASVTSAAASTDQSNTAAQVGAMASQALTSQTVAATTTSVQDASQLANSTSQTQPVASTAVQPTAEQWYQQQQQYQQYYQQYPGYDPYQQQYQHQYPYQQSAVPQYQPHMQAYGQPQPQPQPQGQTQTQPQPQPQPQAPGHSQPISHAPVTPQSQNQIQVSQQQQLQPAAQQHNQIQALGNPTAHGQAVPQSQPYSYPQTQPQPQQHMPMPHYQQPLPQMQHSQPPVQQPVQNFPISQPQVHQHLQPHAPVQHIPQSQMHSQQLNQPLTQIQPQLQTTSAHGVTGHNSYPQPQPHQNIQMAAPQRPTNMHPQGGPQPHSQHPTQQYPVMRPHQSHGVFPNQQQPALFPSPAQGQSIPPQQQQLYGHAQQPAQINHRPLVQPVQQPMLQQPFVQQQMPVPSHLRPQGPAPSFSEHVHSYSQPHANVAPSHNSQPSQPQNAVGRPPVMPNHTVQLQPFAQSVSASLVRPTHSGASHLHGNQNLMGGINNQLQLPSDLQSRALEPYGKQGAVPEQKTDSSSGIPGKSLKDSDMVPVAEVDAKFEKDGKQVEVGNNRKSEGPQSLQTSESDNLLNKNFVKEEASGSTWQPLTGDKPGETVAGPQNDTINDHSGVKDKEAQDGHQLKNSSLLGTELSDSQSGKLQKDDRHTQKPPTVADNVSPTVSQTIGTPQGPGVNEHKNITPLGQGQSGGSQLSGPAPFADQDKHRSIAGQSFQNHSIGPPGRYNQGQLPYPGAPNLSSLESSGRPQFASLSSGEMHGGMNTNLPPHAPEGLRDQQHPTNMMVAESYPHHRPGFLNGPQGFASQEERFKPYPVPGQQNIDRRDFEDDFKRFPAPYLDAEPASKFRPYSLGPHDRGSHGFNYDSGSKLNPMGSKLFPPPYSLNEAGERPVGFHDDAIVKSDSAHRPDYLGIGPRHGRHHGDGLTPRSPTGEGAEIYLGRPGVHSAGLVSKSGLYDFDGRDHHFGDSVGGTFRDGRFPHLPSHYHRDEFEGPGNLRIGEHPRSEFIGQDDFGGHFRRGDHLGPHNLPRHLPLGDPLGFGARPGHMRAAELGGHQNFELFSRGDRPGHPRLGEPGFRSSFSLTGFPNDGGFLTVKS